MPNCVSGRRRQLSAFMEVLMQKRLRQKPDAEKPPTNALMQNDAEVVCKDRARKDFQQHNSGPFKAKELARKLRTSLQSYRHWH